MREPRQQPPCGLGIAADLDDFVETIAVLIDSAPEGAFLTIDRDGDSIEMPYILPARRLAFHSAGAIGAIF